MKYVARFFLFVPVRWAVTLGFIVGCLSIAWQFGYAEAKEFMDEPCLW